MNTKKCCMCKENLSLDSFMSNKMKKGGLQAQCKACQKVYRREHYLLNRQKYIDKAALRNKKSRQDYIEAKSNYRCLICFEDNPVCIDFHHLEQDDKKHNISMISTSFGSPKFLQEIDKCVPLCSNCHRKFHAGQFSLMPKCCNSSE